MDAGTTPGPSAVATAAPMPEPKRNRTSRAGQVTAASPAPRLRTLPVVGDQPSFTLRAVVPQHVLRNQSHD